MRHRRCGLSTYRLNGLGKGDEHPPSCSRGMAPFNFSGLEFKCKYRVRSSTSVLLSVQSGTSCDCTSGWWRKCHPVYVSDNNRRWISTVVRKCRMAPLRSTILNADAHYGGLYFVLLLYCVPSIFYCFDTVGWATPV